MSCLAVITARGGSKRIPRKNIRPFCGRPILAYSIEAALQSGVFEEVMVSTDDEEIAAVARQYGAAVPFLRSAETSGDFASSSDAVAEVLRRYAADGRQFDLVANLYPTAPFLTAERLGQAVARLLASDAETLVPVVRFSFPPQRGFVITDGALCLAQPQYRETRSQDLEPMYHDAGQFYLARADAFARCPRFYGEHILPFELPELEVQDIDTLSDWEIAEFKYRLLHKEEHP